MAKPKGASDSFKGRGNDVAEVKQNKEERKGFAGLSSLVSDVDTTLLPVAKEEPASTSGATSSPPPSASQTAQPQPTQQQPYQEPPLPSSGSSGGKWFIIGIAAVIGVLWLIGQSNKPTTTSAPTYSPPVQNTVQNYTPPAQSQVTSRPVEIPPPVGQSLVLSTAQIRYCLAESIRLDGAKAVVNNYNDSEVARFNALVSDYNSRCGNFRYQNGVLESARRDIEPYRSLLQTEGSAVIVASRLSDGTQQLQTPLLPLPNVSNISNSNLTSDTAMRNFSEGVKTKNGDVWFFDIDKKKTVANDISIDLWRQLNDFKIDEKTGQPYTTSIGKLILDCGERIYRYNDEQRRNKMNEVINTIANVQKDLQFSDFASLEIKFDEMCLSAGILPTKHQINSNLIVTSDKANIRSRASYSESTVIGELPKGTVFTSLFMVGGYYAINHSGTTGYVSTKSVRVIY